MSSLQDDDSLEPSSSRMLLVEDDVELAKLICDFLRPHNITVDLVHRGDTAVKMIRELTPDVVILDVNLPGLDGFSVCRMARQFYTGAIIMLTARGSENDEVLGFEHGADDYLSKPVRPNALLARVRTHLRKQAPLSSIGKTFVIGDMVVDAASRSVSLSGVHVDLTSAEFDLLMLLAENAGKLLTRNDISMAIHGIRYDGIDRSIDLRISRLRRKIGDDPTKPKRIISVRGTGYQLSLES
jgi:DNA-binding response OmpR family regulator